MFKKKENTNYESSNNDIIEHYDINEYYNEPNVDDILDDICPKPKQKRTRKKSTDKYYVKGADLLEEIKKYRESKQKDAEVRRCTI